MKEINFTVTIDEANLILKGIGLLPFAEVYQLVAKLQQQAGRQLDREAGNGGERHPGSSVESVEIDSRDGFTRRRDLSKPVV